MNRIIVFLLVGGIILALAYCGADGNLSTNLDNKDFFIKVQDSNVVDAEVTNALRSLENELASELNASFSLPDRDITIIFEDCDEENAYYQPATSEVTMCYELLNAILLSKPEVRFSLSGLLNSLFSSKPEGEELRYSLGEALGIFFEFILLHEIGHAFVDHYDIKVLGSTEDAADTIAAVWMIADNDTAEERVESAMHIILAGDYLHTKDEIDEKTNWGGKHSVGPQRHANLVCWAVGAEPTVTNVIDVQEIVDQLNAAGRNCENEFQEKVSSVKSFIGKYAKK
jgi:hypothetical protein